MNNQQLADKLNLIANLLEIKGEVVFKIRAYQRAAESLTSLGTDASDLLANGTLTDVPGIGKAISEKIQELLATGKLEFLENLSQEVPPSLVSMLQIPDMGPKKVSLVWKQLNLTTVEELEAAARAGKLRDLPGMGEKSEQKILAGIESLKRRSGRIPLGIILPFVESIIHELQSVPGVHQIAPAGSIRRRRSTVGDIDLLVSTDDSQAVMQVFVSHPSVVRIIGHGSTKSSVEFSNGLRAQLWAHPKNRFGTALQYATGSKDHNVQLRELAQSINLSLSEHAFLTSSGEEITCETEEMVYQNLGLPWIPPELREGRGEIQAARNGKLPRLIDIPDIIAELHTHSTWSDGRVAMREMVQAAVERGYKVIAVTDHSHSLGIVQGVKPEDLINQRKEIEQLRAEFGDQITILHGVEMEIKADGSLDYSDDILAWLDIVIASLHVSLRQPREQITQRLLNAIKNPHVDIIGHPTGRLLPDREGADLDFGQVLSAAAGSGVALEINANPNRLDLDDIYARQAAEMGIPLAINTDAHHPDHMAYLSYGVGVARRAWVEPVQVLNSWSPADLLQWLKKRS